MVFYEPDTRDRELLPHDPFKAFIAPRPIGWVSTLGPEGEVNLAPYSYFNAVSDRPPMVMFSSDGPKDSATFASSGGEFVWNLATYDLREQMNLTSKALPRGESEFEFGGLEMAPSRLVAPPRVAATPVALECRVSQRARDRRGEHRHLRRGRRRPRRRAPHRRRACRHGRDAADRALRLPRRLRGGHRTVRDDQTVNRSVGPTRRGPAWIALMLVEAVGGLLVGGSLACAASTFVRGHSRLAALLFAAALAARRRRPVRRRPDAARRGLRAGVRRRAGDGRGAARAPAAAVLAGLPDGRLRRRRAGRHDGRGAAGDALRDRRRRDARARPLARQPRARARARRPRRARGAPRPWPSSRSSPRPGSTSPSRGPTARSTRSCWRRS